VAAHERAARSFGSDVVRSGVEQVGEVGRQRRPHPVARSTASGNLAGWAVASVTIGRAGSGRARAAAVPVAVCGSISIPVSRAPADLGDRGVVVEAGGTERPANHWSLVVLDVEAPVARNRPELLGGHPTVAPVHLEQQPLEVRRHLDVHARDSVGTTSRSTCRRLDEAGEDVVGVRADHESRRSARPSPGRSSRRARCRSCRWAR
jgi:hypothetical protein